MTKYLVVILESVDDGTPDEPFESPSTKEVILCEGSRAVARAIQSVQGDPSLDWNLFEVVGGKSQRRSATLKMDGRVIYDCEIA